MPTFLSDPTLTLYVLLVLFAAFFGWLWSRKRDRRTRILATVAVALTVMLFACDFLIESPREQAVRKIRAMEASANSRDWVNTFKHVSEKFRYDSKTKAAFRSAVAPLAAQHNATVHFKDFDRDNVTYLPNDQIRLGFVVRFSATGVELVPFYMEATFAQEADREYRMIGFTMYDYVKRREGGEQKLPGL